MSGIEGAPGLLTAFEPTCCWGPRHPSGGDSREGYMPHGQRWLPGRGAVGLRGNFLTATEGRGGRGRPCQAGTAACAKAPGCETAGLGLVEEPRTPLV